MDYLIQGAQRIPSVLAAFGWKDGTDDHVTSLNRGIWYILAKKSWVPARA
jgi:hypothetical protein